MRVSGVRTRVLLCLLLVMASVVTVLTPSSAYAAQITTRSLTLKQQTGVTTGGSAPSGVADHSFTFTPATTASIGSIRFLYCTTATGTCTTPTGMSSTAATFGSMSSGSGWTVNNATQGSPYITHTAASMPSATPVTAQINSVTNPSTANQTFFVRITTYTGTDGATGATDAGVVAASTTQTITVTGVMPEYLSFCTGETITVTSNIPNCASATPGMINFNQEFSPSATAHATSMMAASTNATSGYVIVANGTTLTSGSNTIPAIGATAATASSSLGTSKFGINLVANTGFGANINPASNGTNLRGLASTNFNTADSYALDLTGATAIAKSDDATPGTPAPTDSQAYTVSYIANVAGSQPAGTYVATLNYICTPTF